MNEVMYDTTLVWKAHTGNTTRYNSYSLYHHDQHLKRPAGVWARLSICLHVTCNLHECRIRGQLERGGGGMREETHNSQQTNDDGLVLL